jgi:hypothetical protein
MQLPEKDRRPCIYIAAQQPMPKRQYRCHTKVEERVSGPCKSLSITGCS